MPVARKERLGRVSSAEPSLPFPEPEILASPGSEADCGSPRQPGVSPGARSGKKRSDSAYASGDSGLQVALTVREHVSDGGHKGEESTPFQNLSAVAFDRPQAAALRPFGGSRACSEPSIAWNQSISLSGLRAVPQRPQPRVSMTKHASAPLLDEMLAMPNLLSAEQPPEPQARPLRPRVVGYLPPPKPEDEVERQATVERLNLLNWPQNEPQLQILSNLVCCWLLLLVPRMGGLPRPAC